MSICVTRGSHCSISIICECMQVNIHRMSSANSLQNGEMCQCRKEAGKEILTARIYWWLEKRRHSVLCSINISAGSNIIHNILQLNKTLLH